MIEKELLDGVGEDAVDDAHDEDEGEDALEAFVTKLSSSYSFLQNRKVKVADENSKCGN
jgi:hypothetical protein